jgi:3-oxoacyl-[acyl-carrier protein] reductase
VFFLVKVGIILKTALVTGATGAIGMELCHMLAKKGYFLFIHYNRNEKKAKSIQKEIFDLYEAESLLVSADLSKNDGPELLCKQLTNKIDVFIYNCGKTHYGLLTDFTNESIQETIQLHLTSAIEISKFLIPDMVQKKSGKMIMISSVWGEVGAACETVYSSAKGGLNSFVKALSKELAPSHISVNCISPGIIDTPMLNQFTKAEKQELTLEIPAGRLGRPEEIAHAAEFLMSEKAAYISGHILSINGSWFT